MKKKILGLVLIFAAGIVFGQQMENFNGFLYEIVDDRSVNITGYTGNATTLNIPAQIQGLPVTSISHNEEYPGRSIFGDNIISIIIPSSVTVITEYALYTLNKLTSITVDNRNPAYSSIDGVLFDKDKRTLIKYPGGKTAKTYTIPSSVTVIGEHAFYFSSSLTSVNIPSSVTFIEERAFDNCRSLTSVTIPTSVTAIGRQAFSYCFSLTSVTIPSSVTAIGDFTFLYCSSLVSITVDSLNPTYASIDGVLFDKRIRTLIKYPQGRNQSSYVIPSSVTSIDNSAFGYCSYLTSVTIPSSVTSIGNRTFYACSNLTSVTIPSSVTFIRDEAFAYCHSLTSVTIPSSVIAIGDGAFSVSASLTSVSLSRRTQVGREAFDENVRITYRD